ncbi:MAG: glycosyltransferase [bacterium]|nr:glycosyltransferase [bacterium]
MLRNRTIITPLNLDWVRPADFQRQTCLELAKKNKVIVYVQHEARFFLKTTTRRVFPKLQNISFYVPTYYIPFRRLRIIEEINRNLSFLIFLLSIRADRKIFWFFDSDFVWMLKFARKNDVTLYDCVDDGLSYKIANGLRAYAQEVAFVKRVRLFFTNSLSLSIRYAKIRSATWVQHAGFDLSNFASLKTSALSQAKKSNKKPRIGFVGCIDDRINFVLLASIAVQLRRADFILCGPIKRNATAAMTRLVKLPNVHHLSEVQRSQIGSIISNLDVCIIPYKSTPKVFFSLPTKLFEYFYFGKPVVSSSILELLRFDNYLKISRTTSDWVREIEKLLNTSMSTIKCQALMQVAINNSWQHKLSAIEKVLEMRMRSN